MRTHAQLTWRVVGPILAESFTVIAPDNRGSGDSSLPADGSYTAQAMASDLFGLLEFLSVEHVLVMAHDKGCGPAVALAAEHPDLVHGLVLVEYVLPGYGYEQFSAPSPAWDLYANWQLAFFGVPDAAEFFIRGRERDMLNWYFWHSSYAGAGCIPEDIVTRYADSIKKPGYLRGMLGPFATYTVASDNAFFAATVKAKPLRMPMLAIGGEASIAPNALLAQLWGSVAGCVMTDVAPKAGHWIPDENPEWLAARAASYLNPLAGHLPPADLTWLEGKVTLV